MVYRKKKVMLGLVALMQKIVGALFLLLVLALHNSKS